MHVTQSKQILNHFTMNPLSDFNSISYFVDQIQIYQFSFLTKQFRSWNKSHLIQKQTPKVSILPKTFYF